MKNDMINEIIQYNIKMHNKAACSYDDKHTEIYNPLEQLRLRKALKMAKDAIKTSSKTKVALDYGSGTGNLTRHLISLDFDVTAADVSSVSLEHLKRKLGDPKRLKTIVINGEDLSYFENDSFDFIATYSVLHHVPDYLKIIREFKRLIRPGGIIYIDHEVCLGYWNQNLSYKEYLNELGDKFYENYLFELRENVRKRNNIIRKAFSLKVWINFFKKPFRNKLITSGGDIHVFIDDHIEWDLIREIFVDFEVITDIEYLVCRQREDRTIWRKYSKRCNDMKMLVIKKPVNRKRV